ncbi:MAG: sulfatase-like hydrolase/transferase [Fibrobacterales bacterium]
MSNYLSRQFFSKKSIISFVVLGVALSVAAGCDRNTIAPDQDQAAKLSLINTTLSGSSAEAVNSNTLDVTLDTDDLRSVVPYPPVVEEIVEEITDYATQYVVLIVIDGVRFSESWGAEDNKYIPYTSNALAKLGVVNMEFYNDGKTKTIPGHTAALTGIRQNMNNWGKELPDKHSYLQEWRKTHNKDSTDAFILTSKGKLEVLADTDEEEWHNKYRPATYCGVDGVGVDADYGYDSTTYRKGLELIQEHYPELIVISFKNPDSFGHAEDWEGYIQAITDSDEYIYRLWSFFETDPVYKGKTTLLVTNDHGRHLDEEGGIHNHGDGCDGCRHINLLAIGPDFKSDVFVNTHRSLIDIPHTIGELMDFEMPHGEGNVMTELFKDEVKHLLDD